MRRLAARIRSFWHEEKGAFATIFGILLIVIVATSGAVVDFVGIQQARTKAQIALDAATLALQPNIYTWDDDALMDAAEDLMIERIADPAVSVDVEAVETDPTSGSLYFKAKLNVPTVFVALVNVPSMDVAVVSQAKQTKERLEVVMVLDVSGSMASYSRMDHLKTAALNAVDIIFDSQPTQPDTFIGVVPFNFFVNVGSANVNAAWMDQNGVSPRNWDNFDDDDDDSTTPSGNFSRLDLYDELTDESWDGCVVNRPYPYDVNDTEPLESDPESMFVPVFQPDWVGDDNNDESYLDDHGGSCPGPTLDGYCEYTSWQNGSWPRRHSELYTDSSKSVLLDSGTNACNCSGETILWQNSYYSGYYGWVTTRACNQYDYPNLSNRELQERICKYTNEAIGSLGNWEGPNASCSQSFIQPLTNTKATVDSAINALSADGGTNIHQGTIWGLRVISPTEPFTEGANYNSNVSKAMIVMTDGENTHYPENNMNCAYYLTAYDYPYNERLGDCDDSSSTLRGLMDDRTLEACQAAKDEGVEVFTIGLQPPSSSTEAMLTDCATDDSHAYFPSAPSELTSVFETIAVELSELRLAL